MARPIIIVEGPFDKHILEVLLNRVFGDHAEAIELQVGGGTDFSSSGKAEAIKHFVRVVKNGLAARVALVVDLDRDSAEELERQVYAQVGCSSSSPPPGTIVLGLGLPEEPLFEEWNITSHSIEDYLFKLFLDKDCYASLKNAESKLKYDHALVLEKLRFMRDKLDSQEMGVNNSKRYLELLRGISGFTVGPGKFGERVIEKTPESLLRDVWAPVIAQVNAFLQSAA